MRISLILCIIILSIGCKRTYKIKLIKEFYPTGEKYRETQIKIYDDGEQVKDGVDITWYKSGSLNSKSHFVDDELQGLRVTWSESGQVLMRSTYKKGRIDGIVSMYYENGNQEKEIMHSLGIRKWAKYWNINGEVLTDIKFKNNRPWSGLLMNEDTWIQYTYKDGVIISEKQLSIPNRLKGSNPRY